MLKHRQRHCSALSCQCAPSSNNIRSFFSYPVHDSERLSQWLCNVKTAQNFTPTQNKYLCEKHFAPEDVMSLPQGAQSPDREKKRLKPGAVPICEWTESPPQLSPYCTEPNFESPLIMPRFDAGPCPSELKKNVYDTCQER